MFYTATTITTPTTNTTTTTTTKTTAKPNHHHLKTQIHSWTHNSFKKYNKYTPTLTHSHTPDHLPPLFHNIKHLFLGPN